MPVKLYLVVLLVVLWFAASLLRGNLLGSLMTGQVSRNVAHG